MTETSRSDAHRADESTIFVSYSREDQKRAKPIIELLERAGYVVWWDGLLDPGERFSHTTEAALERARAVVVLWSKASTASHWVHDEATRGRDRRVLVPLSLDGSEAPLGFRQFQVIDFSKARLRPEAPQVQALLRALAALHDRLHVEPELVVQPRISRRAVIGGGAAVLVAGGAAGAWRAGLLGGGPGKASVAVLPFANLSGDPEQAYFSDGLAAEIRSQLARNELLQVAARTSSNLFRERRDDAPTIARKLRVAYLLDGSVRRAGERVKISVELIKGSTGLTEWEESFEPALTDLLTVQDEIAAKVASALSAEIDSGGKTRKAVGGTESVTAFDAYLRGRDLYETGIGEPGLRLALARFDEAVAADPGYAAAQAARSRALAVIAGLHADPGEGKAMFAQAIAAAQRAVTLAPTYAEGHSALGFAITVGKLDMKAAAAAYASAYRLGQGDADVLSRYAVFRAWMADGPGAERAILAAAALDPLNGRTFRTIGDVRYQSGRYPEAIAAYRQALALAPQFTNMHTAIGLCLLLSGKTEEAAAEFAQDGDHERELTSRALVEGKRGNRAKAEAALATMIREFGDKDHYQYAQVYAQWGEPDRAIEQLRQARAVDDAGLVQMYSDPLLAPLRKRPEFIELLKSLRFV